MLMVASLLQRVLGHVCSTFAWISHWKHLQGCSRRLETQALLQLLDGSSFCWDCGSTDYNQGCVGLCCRPVRSRLLDTHRKGLLKPEQCLQPLHTQWNLLEVSGQVWPVRFGNWFANWDFRKCLEMQEWNRELPGFWQSYQNIHNGSRRQHLQPMCWKTSISTYRRKKLGSHLSRGTKCNPRRNKDLSVRHVTLGAWRNGPGLRAFAAYAEALGSVPTVSVVAHNSL